MVVLLPCKHSEVFCSWDLVMVGLVVDLACVEIEAGVEDFDFVEEVAVVEMEMKGEGFDLEVVVVDFVVGFVGEDSFDKMEDIDNIEQISHKDFVPLVPMIEIDTDFEVEAKVVAKNSNLMRAENSLDC